MRQSAVDVIRRNGLTGSMKNKLELPPGLGLSLISHFCPFTTTTAKLDSSICILCPHYYYHYYQNTIFGLFSPSSCVLC